MFEKASRLKLRFGSTIGPLSSEDLWDLSLQQLNTLAKSLKKVLKESEEEDFLKETNEADVIVKLQFDLVLHVLNTKKDERKAYQEATEKKAKRQKILGIIAKKQDDSLEDMTEEELLKLLDN